MSAVMVVNVPVTMGAAFDDVSRWVRVALQCVIEANLMLDSCVLLCGSLFIHHAQFNVMRRQMLLLLATEKHEFSSRPIIAIVPMIPPAIVTIDVIKALLVVRELPAIAMQMPRLVILIIAISGAALVLIRN